MNEFFFLPEESNFYSYCIETMVLNRCKKSETIVEFGSGGGRPVVDALLRTEFEGLIHGFEINSAGYESAKALIRNNNLSGKYKVSNLSFFEQPPEAEYLIANPPYVPVRDGGDKNIYRADSYGGSDGSMIIKRLLSIGYSNILLMFSGFSNPEGIAQHALSLDYYITNFLLKPRKYGSYTSQPFIKDTISELRKKSMAFCSENIYMLAGALFQKRQFADVNLTSEFIKIIKSL